MLMMQQMRNNMTWIMLIMAAAFVGWMVLQGVNQATGRGSALASGELGSVNGEEITYREYQAVYQRLYQQRQQQLEQAISPAQNDAIQQAAWDQIVRRTLIQQELEERGIRVTDEEILQAARYAPPPMIRQSERFQTNGQFDLQKYHRFLASPAVSGRLLRQLESYYRSVIPRTKLFQQVTSGLYVPDAQLWRMWRDRHATTRIRYVRLDPSALVSDAEVSISEREIAAYYEAHREEFRRPAEARVKVVTIEKSEPAVDTTAADTATVDSTAAFQRRLELLGRVDSLEALGADLPLEAAAGRLGLPIRTVEVDRDRAYIPGLGQVDRAVEWIFEEARPGAVSLVFENENAFYMLELVERTPSRILSLEEATPRIRARLLEKAKLERARRIGRNLVEQIRGGTTLVQVAAERGLELRETEPFTRVEPVPGIGRANAVIGTAFGLEPGQTSGVITANDRLYILTVLEENEASREQWKEQLEQQRTRVVRALRRSRWQQFLSGLREQAEIVDRREQVLEPATATG